MIRMQDVAVHLVSHHDAAIGIQTPVELDRRAIVPIRQLVCTFETDISRATQWLSSAEKITNGDACPEGCRKTGSSPRETLSFADHVLFFSAVPSADQCDGISLLHIVLNKVSDSHGDGLSDHALHGERPVEDRVVCAFRNMAMVP